MKMDTRWMAIPAALAMVFAGIGPARSETIQITTRSQAIAVQGLSGGPAKDTGCAGYIAKSPNHVVQVTEDNTYLRFSLEGAGQPTFLITGPQGRDCIPADSLSGGKITLPGRWDKGTYSIFVGDRAQGQHAYTLSISPKP